MSTELAFSLIWAKLICFGCRSSCSSIHRTSQTSSPTLSLVELDSLKVLVTPMILLREFEVFLHQNKVQQRARTWLESYTNSPPRLIIKSPGGFLGLVAVSQPIMMGCWPANHAQLANEPRWALHSCHLAVGSRCLGGLSILATWPLGAKWQEANNQVARVMSNFFHK